ncbi:triose-phosphate isomerase [Mycoplasma sp. NEAQ87857]|nr:triose-phosphate isomerase [Mycoplasma sp. NEAQ87857]
MNKTFSETKQFLEEFNTLYQSEKSKIASDIEYGIAAPFTNLAAFKDVELNGLAVAAENMSNHLSGAYTGEVSVSMLKDLNVKYVILGHSERRSYYGETDALVYEKAKLAIENGLVPVICVGETLEEYEANKTKEVVEYQIKHSVNDLDLSKIIVAYEPIWAIGTGKVATPQTAQEVCEFIHSITSDELVVQYGGSVSPANIEELSQQKDINGFLVGGASLKADSFIKLLTLGK